MASKRVLSVGQCLADHWSISGTFAKHFDAEVVPVHNWAEALEHLQKEKFDLVLVNRVFDADGASGLELIQACRAKENLPQVPVMLVSNYEEAQREAVTAGAVPGFGKGALGQPAMLARVKVYLNDRG